jgi:hypothetical protein
MYFLPIRSKVSLPPASTTVARCCAITQLIQHTQFRHNLQRKLRAICPAPRRKMFDAKLLCSCAHRGYRWFTVKEQTASSTGTCKSACGWPRVGLATLALSPGEGGQPDDSRPFVACPAAAAVPGRSACSQSSKALYESRSVLKLNGTTKDKHKSLHPARHLFACELLLLLAFNAKRVQRFGDGTAIAIGI